MAENELKQVELKEGEVVVSQEVLSDILKKTAEMEKSLEDDRAKMAGLEAMMEANLKDDSPMGDGKLRMKKNFEPAFRTARVRQYPIAGNHENMGYVIGWTNRGAYSKVVDIGLQKEKVDYIDIIFLDEATGEGMRSPEGKLQAESVPLLSLLNEGQQTHCKIISIDKNVRLEPTGEEIKVVEFNEAHGMMETGQIVDGYVAFTDMTLSIQIPGLLKPITIDAKYVN